MLKRLAIFVIVIGLCASLEVPSSPTSLAAYPTIKNLGLIKVPNPGFINLTKLSASDAGSLIISSFGVSPLAAHGVYVVPNVGSLLNQVSNIKPKLTVKLSWPNAITPVPTQVFGGHTLAVPSGFLVPGQSTGAVSIASNLTTTPMLVDISVPKSGWFYHHVEWRDMNGDGLLDAITARATKPIIGQAGGELVWYEQPKTKPLDGTAWALHHIADGPDFFFHLYDLDNDGTEEMIAAQFFTSELVLYVDWKTSAIQKIVIDSTIGPLFDCEFVDLNNDGVKELLVSNHDNKANISGVYAYEIPKNFKTEKWTRHTIAEGFETVQKGPGAASPGQAFAFSPKIGDKSMKPLIALGGDGNEAAYLITPASQLKTNWTYTRQQIYSGSSTVGQILVGDVDNNGFNELFVPLYDISEISVFTFTQ